MNELEFDAVRVVEEGAIGRSSSWCPIRPASRRC